MTVATATPAVALPPVSAGVGGGISTRALVAWALQAPGSAIQMTAPRMQGLFLPEDDGADENELDSSELADDEFDTRRFSLGG